MPERAESKMELKPKSRMEIEGIVQGAIQDAVDFVESEISEDRIKAQRYFDGEVDLGYEDGRSKVVATKVRDTIRAVKPSLMRVFLSTAKPVEFVPNGPEDVAMAQQATDFVNHEFNRLNGYRILNDVFHDALIKKQGIKGPDGYFRKDQFQLVLSDNIGRWKGKGVSNLISYQEPFLTQMPLKKGTYTLTIFQNMRDENLESVNNLGLQVVRGQLIL